MQKKRIILHIGAHKTGSTALQQFFSENHARLAELGIDYPAPEDEAVTRTGSCVGNVVKLAYQHQAIGTGEAGPDGNRPKISLEKAFAFIARTSREVPAPAVLFSGESMAFARPDEIRNLTDFVSEDCTVHAVMFVRDPFDYAFSAWRQHLKTGRSLLSFDAYVQRRTAPPELGFLKYRAPENYAAANVPLTVMNYDTYRHDLIPTFMKAIGHDIRLDDGCKPSTIPVTNRSLTPSESMLQLMVNRRFEGTHFPATVSKALRARPAGDVKATPYYRRDIHQILLDCHLDQIEAINKIIIGDPLGTEPRQADIGALAVEPAELEVLFDCMELVQSRRRSAVAGLWGRVLDRLMRPSVPADFDPEAYLFHNEDVRAAGINPRRHYAAHGRKELRPYRYI